MKKLLSILVLCLLTTGCLSTSEVKKTLNVTWQIVENEVTTMNVGRTKSDSVIKQQYGWVGSGIEIKADMDGDTSGEFNFRLTSDVPTEQIANNIIKINPDKPEKGNLSVRKDGQEVIIEYEVFPQGVLYPHSWYPEVPVGFDFEKGIRKERYTESVYMQGLSMELLGKIVIIDPERGGEEWLHDFAEINNLHEYEYREYEDVGHEIDLSKIYLVKCKNGYAAMKFISSGGVFIYKYSETGIFE